MTDISIDLAARQDIEAAFSTEQASDHLAVGLAEIPVSYSRISPEWWTALLCGNVPGAAVTGYSAVPPDDFDRGHMRIMLEYNEAGRVAGLPPSVFCKDSQRLAVRLFNAQCDTVQPESIFYKDVKPLVQIDGPEALYAAYNAETHNSLLVMRDLNLESAHFCVPATEIGRAAAEQQMDHLARLHARFYGKTASHPVIAGLRTFHENSRRYDQALKLAETTQKGFLASEHVVPRKLWLQADQIWPATLKALCLHKDNPVTLTHNDAHIKNWYATAAGGMCLADWQCIARAHWSHDVTFTISTSLTIENRRAWDRDLLAHYRDRLHAHGGPALDVNEMIRAYRMNLLISLCWWTPCVKHDQGFSYHPQDDIAEVIRRTSTAIDDWSALSVS